MESLELSQARTDVFPLRHFQGHASLLEEDQQPVTGFRLHAEESVGDLARGQVPDGISDSREEVLLQRSEATVL